MRVAEIINGQVHRIYPEYRTAAEARRHYAPNIVFEDCPDDTYEGWAFDDTKQGDERFSRPALADGWAWDDTVEPPQPYNVLERRAEERLVLHSATSDDTQEALRKLREGDTSIDWQAWLDALDAYNRAVSATKEQETYPESVVYPEYPTKPAA